MARMTVSQGLRAVADLKGRIKKHKEHAQGAVTWDAENIPAFMFSTELEGAEKARDEMLRLQTAIAVANATTEIEWQGKKVLVAWAVRQLEEIKGQLKWLDELEPLALDQPEVTTNVTQERYADGRYVSVNVISKRVCALPKAKRFAAHQAMQEEFNRLNDVVEASNHQTVLKERPSF
jgi:hypothetical protein